MKKRKQPLVVIIIVTFNPNLKILKNCLNSLRNKTNYKNYKVIISDNNSTNGLKELIKEKYKWIDLIENKKNLYWAGGNNIGIKYSIKKYNPDYFFLLNDDTKIIQKDWLTKLVETAESDERIGIVGCNLIYPDGSLQHSGGYIKGLLVGVEKEPSGIKEVDHVMGSAILIKRSVVDKIGLIDEIFTPYLLDETDYCLRAKKAGFKVLCNRNVKIIHYKGQTINNLEKEDVILFTRFKNDAIFSLINLNGFYAIFRLFFYPPWFVFFQKKDERLSPSIKNIKLRKRFFHNTTIILKGFLYLIKNISLILKKRQERKLNKKILS
ncbi:MAG: glycosyltransferase family 2 protein [Candidatus Pacearchaeota archaeon]